MARPNQETVNSLAKKWASDIAARAEESFLYQSDLIRKRCESPIEEMLAISIFYQLRDYVDNPDDELSGINWMTRAQFAWPGEAQMPFGGIFIWPQAAIGRYRADLLVTMKSGPTERPKYLVVEADGHDYHERTKEQAAKDKSRDRWMTTEGITLLRFTGSEIWRDPLGCGEQVCGLIADIYHGKK